MQNNIKSQTRLVFIQFVFSHLSKPSNEFEKIKSEFDYYFYNKVLTNISNQDEIKIKYNKNYFSKLVDFYSNFIVLDNIKDNLNKYISFDRKFEKWDIINQAIVLSILSELSNTKKEKIVIALNNYLNIAKNFVSLKEVGMINAVVDNFLNDKKIL